MKLYCSDIHEEVEDDTATCAKEGEYSIFTLKFLQPFLTNEKDADDDLIKITKYQLPFLPGKLPIDDVGFQIWRASFFLSEYLLDHPQMLKGKCVVELGAGSALPSMIARHYSEEVMATDLDHVLKVTRKSIELNHEALNMLKPVLVSECSWDDPNGRLLSSRFDVCIAADVCYSHLTTMKFFRMIKKLLHSGTRRILVSLEERPNFMTDTMSVESTERDRFLKHIAHLQQTYPITCQFVPTSSVSQYFLYERTKRLALYDIKVNIGCSITHRANELYNSEE